MAEPGVRTLVIRGDFNSASGYAHAIGLYVERLAHDYDAVLGVELHGHPSRHLARWPYPLITDTQLGRLSRRGDAELDVVTFSTPDNFARVPNARNIGLFFWETDRLGRPDWIAVMNTAVDEMWVPTQFMAEMLRREGLAVPIVHRPCPLPRPLASDLEAFDRLILHSLEASHGAVDVVTIGELRTNFAELCLSVGTLIPRKGLPMLTHEWIELARTRPELGLILKVGSIDVTKREADVVSESAAIVDRVARRQRASSRGIYLLTARLSPWQMNALTGCCDAYITTSLGEGFGLGVFESLALGRPVLCPRHTAPAELLPPDYRYFLDTEWDAVGLADPTGLYPISARWGLAKPGSLAAAYDRLSADRQAGLVEAELQRALLHAEETAARQWGRSVA